MELAKSPRPDPSTIAIEGVPCTRARTADRHARSADRLVRSSPHNETLDAGFRRLILQDQEQSKGHKRHMDLRCE